MKNYMDFSADKRKQIRDESTYTHQSLKSENPTFIERSEWSDYVYDLAEEMGSLDSAVWPLTCIDWSKAEDELEYDYTTVNIDDEEYLFRSF